MKRITNIVVGAKKRRMGRTIAKPIIWIAPYDGFHCFLGNRSLLHLLFVACAERGKAHLWSAATAL